MGQPDPSVQCQAVKRGGDRGFEIVEVCRQRLAEPRIGEECLTLPYANPTVLESGFEADHEGADGQGEHGIKGEAAAFTSRY